MHFKQLNLSPPEENNIMVNVSYMLNLLHVKWLKVCWPLHNIPQVFPLAFPVAYFVHSHLWTEKHIDLVHAMLIWLHDFLCYAKGFGKLRDLS